MDEMEEDTDDEKNQILMSNLKYGKMQYWGHWYVKNRDLCWPCVYLYSVTFHLAKVWVVLQSL